MVSYPEDFNPVLRNWKKGVLLRPEDLKNGVEPPHWEVKEVWGHPANNTTRETAPELPQHVQQRSLWATSKSLWKTYCKNSTIHGIRFASADDISIVLRVFWACALIGSAVIAGWVCKHFFEEAQKYPTVTRVAEDHLELHNVVFPAIAICPTNRVRLSVARGYIRKHLEASRRPAAKAFLRLPNLTYERQIHSFVTAMSHFELQSLRAAEVPFTRSQRLLAALVDLNITDFMLTVLPKCEELVSKCEWHGLPLNCCKELVLQQSPIGYCYSFNSLSSMERKYCTFSTEGITVEHTSRHTLSAKGGGCKLRRTTGFGVGSGLRVEIRELHKEHSAEGVEEMLMVALYSPIRYPKAGSFGRIRPNANQNLVMAISLDSTKMSPDVGQMDYRLTNCLGRALPDDLKPTTLGFYTYSTCTLECRLDFMKQKCGCFPYFFGGTPQCKTTDLLRCTRLCKQINWQIPPDDPEIQKKFGNLDQSGTNCTKCVPLCQSLAYYPDIAIQYTRTHNGVINVFFRDLTAAKLYRVDRNYASVDIATYLGSIAGLCLGCSILTLVEITFYLAKLIKLVASQYGGILDATWNHLDKKKIPKYNFPLQRKILNR